MPASLDPSLPTELCELIIDFCHVDTTGFPLMLYINTSYHVLRACCLTCRSWLSRSRFNLYSVVVVSRYSNLRHLLRAITLNPSLADFPHSLWISHPNMPMKPGDLDYYVPFASYEVVRVLRNVRTLLLDDESWNKYPPRYQLLVAAYPIVELRLSMAYYHGLKDVLRLIWAFRSLQYLQLSRPRSADYAVSMLSESDAHHISESARRRRDCCIALRKLELTDGIVPSTNFPPEMAFGTSITELVVQRSFWPEFGFTSSTLHVLHDPQALLTYVASLHLLQTLTLELVPESSTIHTTLGMMDTVFSEWIAWILARLRGSTSLHSIYLSISSHDEDTAPVIPFVLNNLINAYAQDSLLSLPSLKQLIVELLITHDQELYVVESWTRELMQALPSLKTCISVITRPVRRSNIRLQVPTAAPDNDYSNTDLITTWRDIVSFKPCTLSGTSDDLWHDSDSDTAAWSSASYPVYFRSALDLLSDPDYNEPASPPSDDSTLQCPASLQLGPSDAPSPIHERSDLYPESQ